MGYSEVIEKLGAYWPGEEPTAAVNNVVPDAEAEEALLLYGSTTVGVGREAVRLQAVIDYEAALVEDPKLFSDAKRVLAGSPAPMTLEQFFTNI